MDTPDVAAAPAPTPAPAPARRARYVSQEASHKIAVGAGGGSFSVLLVWLLKAIWDVDMPVEVGMAAGTFVTTLLSVFTPTFGGPDQ